MVRLCGHRDVSTLDHQLPKMKYPLLAVVPINLVPACGICNWLKGEHVPETASEQTHFYPYYDDVADQQWLFARLKSDFENRPPEVSYQIRPPRSADCASRRPSASRTAKMSRHAEHYGPNAVREMSSIRGSQKSRTAAGRPRCLRLSGCTASS
ncbi:hypothetical protein SALBM311S_12175 [Streptomyces alboniger]